MSASLKPKLVLILWFLIGQGGSAWRSEIRPAPSAADRKALEKAKLVTKERRGRRDWIEVTDAGWAWANNNLDAPLPLKTQSASLILQAWLTRLSAFMQRSGIALAELIAADEKQGEASSRSAVSIEEHIRRAYLEATGGIWNERVRLSDLRGRLDGVEKNALDRALLKMQQTSNLVLFRLDNQREITNDDREASLLVGGEPRHVLRIGG